MENSHCPSLASDIPTFRQDKIVRSVAHVQMSTTHTTESIAKNVHKTFTDVVQRFDVLAIVILSRTKCKKNAIRFRGRDNHFFSKENVRDNVQVLKSFNLISKLNI